MTERLGVLAGSTEIYTLAISYGMRASCLASNRPQRLQGTPSDGAGAIFAQFLDDELASLGQSLSNAAREALLQERVRVFAREMGQPEALLMLTVFIDLVLAVSWSEQSDTKPHSSGGVI